MLDNRCSGIVEVCFCLIWSLKFLVQLSQAQAGFYKCLPMAFQAAFFFYSVEHPHGLYIPIVIGMRNSQSQLYIQEESGTRQLLPLQLLNERREMMNRTVIS